MTGTLFDIGPDGTACPKCGAMTYRYRATVKGREVWCWPGGDDGETCPDCWARRAAGRERARIELAQANAAIPPLFRGPSLRDHYVVQAKDEADAPFIARCKEGRASDSRCWGVSRADLPALRALKAWQPEDGSIFLEGKPGTGKTLLACALANDLVSKATTFVCVCVACKARWTSGDLAPSDELEPTPWVGVDQHSHKGPKPAVLRIEGPRDVRFVKEGRLIGALGKPKEGGETQHKDDEFVRATAASVLVFDDLGTEEAIQEWHKDRLFRMVDDRYTAARPAKPTIFTSNLSLPVLSLRYGERFASRVREMVGPRNYVITTPWRTP